MDLPALEVEEERQWLGSKRVAESYDEASPYSAAGIESGSCRSLPCDSSSQDF